MQMVVESIGPFFSIIGAKYLINEIVYNKGNMDKIVFWIVFICLGTFLYKVISKWAYEKQNYCNDHFARNLDLKLSKYTMKMKFEHTENAEMLEKLNLALKSLYETGQIQVLINGISSLVSSIIVLGGLIYIVTSCSVWLLIPMVFSFIVATIVQVKITKIKEEYFEIDSEQWRVSEYYSEELSKNQYAKDIRIFSAADMLVENQTKLGERIYQTTVKYMKKQWSKERISVVIQEICNICIYTIIAINVLFGKIKVGNFYSVLSSALRFAETLNGIAEVINELRYTGSVLKFYFEYMDMVEEEQEQEKAKITQIPDLDKGITIEFKNVSFKYPNTDVYILKNVSTKINSGEHLSIVGKNGAGKTTFIKLLCRLYEIEEGQILINGVNIQDIDYNEHVKVLSVIFQDYKLLALSIKDNICCGKCNEDMNALSDRVKEISKQVGINDWIESLDKKENTNLYKMFDEAGVEPSGGQAQKLAIARALFKDSPLVILDEPTAALDPIAEYDIYKNFDSLVGGKTAVYISHRLSSCRFCDRIIVFNDGTIIEDGDHDKLMKIKDGFYRNMYETQAKHYQA